MSAITPDIDGFIAAQDDLREQFGNDIVFSVPVAPEWPGGTRINPDTGEPYSAMVVRTNAEYTTVTIKVLVIEKEASPLRPQADAQFTEGGLRSGIDMILDVSVAGYASVQNASEFTFAARNFRIEEFKPFWLAGTPYRYLCYGRER